MHILEKIRKRYMSLAKSGGWGGPLRRSLDKELKRMYLKMRRLRGDLLVLRKHLKGDHRDLEDR